MSYSGPARWTERCWLSVKSHLQKTEMRMPLQRLVVQPAMETTRVRHDLHWTCPSIFRVLNQLLQTVCLGFSYYRTGYYIESQPFFERSPASSVLSISSWKQFVLSFIYYRTGYWVTTLTERAPTSSAFSISSWKQFVLVFVTVVLDTTLGHNLNWTCPRIFRVLNQLLQTGFFDFYLLSYWILGHNLNWTLPNIFRLLNQLLQTICFGFYYYLTGYCIGPQSPSAFCITLYQLTLIIIITIGLFVVSQT